MGTCAALIIKFHITTAFLICKRANMTVKSNFSANFRQRAHIYLQTGLWCAWRIISRHWECNTLLRSISILHRDLHHNGTCRFACQFWGRILNQIFSTTLIQSYRSLFPWLTLSPSFALCSLASYWVKSSEASVSDNHFYATRRLTCCSVAGQPHSKWYLIPTRRKLENKYRTNLC